jgi:glycosyltransferase involved in cell wall biosynthesis
MGSVATIHDLIPLRHPTLFSRRTAFVFRRSLTYAAQAERVVAVSSHTADEARRALGIAAERLTVVPPPVELGETTQEVPPVQPPYVLHMSGFDPLKGVTDLLLPAFARISGDAPDVRLVMTGPPSAWRARAQRTAEELGMASRVVFAGLVAPSTRVAFLEHAAVVVVSSHEEGFGMPAIEGLAAGLPVAVGPAAATREAVGELGHLAGEPTPESLAATLQDALRAPGPDSETAEARRKHARRFSAASVARRLAELYDEVAP